MTDSPKPQLSSKKKSQKNNVSRTRQFFNKKPWIIRGILIVLILLVPALTFLTSKNQLSPQFIKKSETYDVSEILMTNTESISTTEYLITQDFPLTSTQSTSSPVISSTVSKTPTPTNTPTFTPSPTITPTPTITPSPTATQLKDFPVATHDLANGSIILSLKASNYSHLFMYHPVSLPLTRLTYGKWDDISPSISPNGDEIVFASNREGQWDLYILKLSTGIVDRITDSPAFENHPTFSPDGLFLAFESNTGGNFDLFITALDDSIEPIQLTTDPALDFAPSWSPQGRQIAFVSHRSGNSEIWLADLDSTNNRFRNISKNPLSNDNFPSWSPSGETLAWSSNSEGIQQIMVWDISGENHPITLGNGEQSAWSPDGSSILTTIKTPNSFYLSGYITNPPGQISLPLIQIPGPISGLDWDNITLPSPPATTILQAARSTPPVLWLPAQDIPTKLPENRQNLVTLSGIEPPNLKLNDVADEAFEALREHIAQIAGWDFLGVLEGAYESLNTPLPPGPSQNWRYTGREILINPAPISAGWLKIIREDIGYQTYWRIFIRARFQDGSRGQPIYQVPWDPNARYFGNPVIYEQGGQYETSLPEGYWIDFTEIARTYGWERLPAQLNWRTYYPGTRFNEFVLRMGIDWQSAMLELYPPEVLITPTSIFPITPSPTPTKTLTPTITPTFTKTPTPSQTLTPSITPSITSTPTNSPSPTSTSASFEGTSSP